VVRRLATSRSPRERLDANIEGNFDEHFFVPQITHAWLSFCGEVPRNSQFARLQRAIHVRMYSNLMSALKHLLPRPETEEAARAISIMIDGLWLRHGLVKTAWTAPGP
jgi:TetR/AcrR family transcriptional repressor of bet genes